jgi:putative multiple sugar transport system substrate-binding protein
MKLLKSVVSAVVLGSVTFSGPALAQGKPTVGIAMPTKASARWIDDGNNIVKVLKERGYSTDLQYAEDDIPNQLSQIENMVHHGFLAPQLEFDRNADHLMMATSK